MGRIDGGGRGKVRVSWIELIPYILGYYSNPKSAVEALRSRIIVTRDEIFSEVPKTGLHWAFDDSFGNHYVIEYL